MHKRSLQPERLEGLLAGVGQNVLNLCARINERPFFIEFYPDLWSNRNIAFESKADRPISSCSCLAIGVGMRVQFFVELV